MLRSLGRPAAAAVALVIATGTAGAQDPRQNEPGKFDFYVLSLSWSPSFCEAAGERGTRRSSNAPHVPIRSSCTAYGRNMSAGFRNFARCLRRASTAA